MLAPPPPCWTQQQHQHTYTRGRGGRRQAARGARQLYAIHALRTGHGCLLSPSFSLSLSLFCYRPCPPTHTPVAPVAPTLWAEKAPRQCARCTTYIIHHALLAGIPHDHVSQKRASRGGSDLPPQHPTRIGTCGDSQSIANGWRADGIYNRVLPPFSEILCRYKERHSGAKKRLRANAPHHLLVEFRGIHHGRNHHTPSCEHIDIDIQLASPPSPGSYRLIVIPKS